MSKQSEAKSAQGYEPKPEARACMNCANYRSDMIEKSSGFSWSVPYFEERNKKCGIGGFAVMKMAICDKFTRKAEA